MLAVVACVLTAAALDVAASSPVDGPRAGPVYAGLAARDPGLDAQAERAAIALGQALEKKGAVDLGSPPLPDVVDGVDSVLAGLVAAAKTKYLEGDFQAALEKANEATSRFEGADAFRTGPAWSSYADALFVRAMAQKRLSKEADSDASLAAIAAAMPKATPDTGFVPPKIALKYAQLVDDLRGKPHVTIEVSSTPAGADVVVDGIAHGKAPVAVADLLAGPHYVALSADGDRVERKVTVNAGSAKVDEKVGDPRTGPAKSLRASLVGPVSVDALLDKAKDVGDDVIFGAVMPDPDARDASLVLVARVKNGVLSVVGARVDGKSHALKNKIEPLVDGAWKSVDGWIGAGPSASPQALLTSAAAASSPSSSSTVASVKPIDDPPKTPPADSDDGGNAVLFVGVGVAGVVAAVVAGVATVLVVNAQRSAIEVKVDASKLVPPPTKG